MFSTDILGCRVCTCAVFFYILCNAWFDGLIEMIEVIRLDDMVTGLWRLYLKVFILWCQKQYKIRQCGCIVPQKILKRAIEKLLLKGHLHVGNRLLITCNCAAFWPGEGNRDLQFIKSYNNQELIPPPCSPPQTSSSTSKTSTKEQIKKQLNTRVG